MKEQFCIVTTKGGYNYYYGNNNIYLVLLHEMQRYIIDNYVFSGRIDIDSCYLDNYINGQDPSLVNHCIAEIDLFLKKGFFSYQNEEEVHPLQLKASKRWQS